MCLVRVIYRTIEVAPGFGRERPSRRDRAGVQLLIDGSDVNAARTVQSYLERFGAVARGEDVLVVEGAGVLALIPRPARAPLAAAP